MQYILLFLLGLLRNGRKWGIETHPPLTFALGGAYSANPSPEPEQRSVEGEAISAGAEKGPSEPLVRNRLAGDW